MSAPRSLRTPCSGLNLEALGFEGRGRSQVGCDSGVSLPGSARFLCPRLGLHEVGTSPPRAVHDLQSPFRLFPGPRPVSTSVVRLRVGPLPVRGPECGRDVRRPDSPSDAPLPWSDVVDLPFPYRVPRCRDDDPLRVSVPRSKYKENIDSVVGFLLVCVSFTNQCMHVVSPMSGQR